jgi:hypothetical protein
MTPQTLAQAQALAEQISQYENALHVLQRSTVYIGGATTFHDEVPVVCSPFNRLCSESLVAVVRKSVVEDLQSRLAHARTRLEAL